MNKKVKNPVHQMELNPYAFAVRRSGTDLMTMITADIKKIKKEPHANAVKFTTIDSIATELYKLREALEILQDEVDENAGQLNPDEYDYPI